MDEGIKVPSAENVELSKAVYMFSIWGMPSYNLEDEGRKVPSAEKAELSKVVYRF